MEWVTIKYKVADEDRDIIQKIWPIETRYVTKTIDEASNITYTRLLLKIRSNQLQAIIGNKINYNLEGNNITVTPYTSATSFKVVSIIKPTREFYSLECDSI